MQQMSIPCETGWPPERGRSCAASLPAAGPRPVGPGPRWPSLTTAVPWAPSGGGAVEFRATEIAQGFLRGVEVGQYHFDLSNHDKTDLGMVCGGKVTVYFQPMGSESLPLLDAVCARLAAGRQGVAADAAGRPSHGSL